MKMDPAHKTVLKIAKKSLDREKYSRLRKLKQTDEIISAGKYSVITSLESKYLSLKEMIKQKEIENEDAFFARNKILLLPSKIKHLEHRFTMEEYNKAEKLIEEIRRELNA